MIHQAVKAEMAPILNLRSVARGLAVASICSAEP